MTPSSPTSVSELLLAMDAYMANKGNGSSYLANKIKDIFENPASYLNIKSGPSKALNKSLRSFANKIDALFDNQNSPFREFKSNLIRINTTIKKFNDKMQDLFSGLTNFHQHITRALQNFANGSVNSTVTFAGMGNIENLLISQNRTMVDLLAHIQGNMNSNNIVVSPDVTVIDIGDTALKKIKDLMNAESPTRGTDNRISPPNINNYNNYGGRYNRTDEHGNPPEKKSLWGWVMRVVEIVGGLFLLGKLKQYLDSTELGQNIKKILKNSFERITQAIGDFFTSPSTIQTFKDGANLIVDGISFVFRNINKYILEPLIDKVMKGDWLATIGDIGGWFFERVIKPIFDNIAKDFQTGEISKGLVKIFLTLVPLAFLPAIVGASGALSGLIVPLGLLATTIGAVSKTIHDTTELMNRTDEQNKMELEAARRGVEGGNQNVQVYEKNVENLRKKLDNAATTLEKTQLQKMIDIENKRLSFEMERHQSNQKIKELMLKRESQGFWGQMWGKARGKDVDSEIEREQMRFREQSLFHTDAIRGLKEELNQLKKQKTMTDNISVIPVKDATVIRPDTKDQILMAKPNGPFDDFLKKMNATLSDKLDTLIEISSSNVEAVVHGATHVSGAVLSKKDGGGPTIIQNGNVDPVKDFRMRAAAHIK